MFLAVQKLITPGCMVFETLGSPILFRGVTPAPTSAVLVGMGSTPLRGELGLGGKGFTCSTKEISTSTHRDQY